MCVLDPVWRPKAGLWMEIGGANRDWKAITHTFKVCKIVHLIKHTHREKKKCFCSSRGKQTFITCSLCKHRRDLCTHYCSDKPEQIHFVRLSLKMFLSEEMCVSAWRRRRGDLADRIFCLPSIDWVISENTTLCTLVNHFQYSQQINFSFTETLLYWQTSLFFLIWDISHINILGRHASLHRVKHDIDYDKTTKRSQKSRTY